MTPQKSSDNFQEDTLYKSSLWTLTLMLKFHFLTITDLVQIQLLGFQGSFYLILNDLQPKKNPLNM